VIFDIVFAPAAERDFHRLAATGHQHVEDALDRLSLTGQGDVRPLVDYPGEYPLRVGAIRVRYTVDRDAGTIVVYRILPRGRAYRE